MRTSTTRLEAHTVHTPQSPLPSSHEPHCLLIFVFCPYERTQIKICKFAILDYVVYGFGVYRSAYMLSSRKLICMRV